MSGDDLLLLEYFWGYEHQRDEVFSHLTTQETVAIVVSVQVEHIDITELVFNFFQVQSEKYIGARNVYQRGGQDDKRQQTARHIDHGVHS